MSNKVLTVLVFISLGLGLFSTWKHFSKDAAEIAQLTMKGMKDLQAKAEEEEQKKQQELLKHKAAELNADTTSPFSGNPKSDIAVVYFFDYRCGYCRKGDPILDELVKTDPNLKIIYKEYPIFQDAIVASAALAGHQQGRYVEMHQALMAHSEKFTKDAVLKIAKALKFDMEKFVKDMEGDLVKAELVRNHKLADELGIKGTPMFIIGGSLTLPGSVSIDEFRSAIQKVREELANGEHKAPPHSEAEKD